MTVFDLKNSKEDLTQLFIGRLVGSGKHSSSRPGWLVRAPGLVQEIMIGLLWLLPGSNGFTCGK